MTIPQSAIDEAEKEAQEIAVLNSEAYKRGWFEGYRAGREYAVACNDPDNSSAS